MACKQLYLSRANAFKAHRGFYFVEDMSLLTLAFNNVSSLE